MSDGPSYTLTHMVMTPLSRLIGNWGPSAMSNGGKGTGDGVAVGFGGAGGGGAGVGGGVSTGTVSSGPFASTRSADTQTG